MKPVVQSAAVVVPPVPAVLPPEKTFFTCHVVSACGPVSCSGNMAGFAAAAAALPDEPPRDLVVAVAGAERRREAD